MYKNILGKCSAILNKLKIQQVIFEMHSFEGPFELSYAWRMEAPR